MAVENAVTNLYVLLADADGDIIVRKTYWVTSGSTVPDGYDDIINNFSVKQSEDGEASRGTILRFFGNTDMEQYSGNGPFTFYAVANYSDAVGRGLADATTISDIEDLTVTFSTAGNVNRTRFLMVAKEDGVALNINQDGQIERTGVNLELKRIDAKVKFYLSVEIPEALQGTTRFENMTYRVHRVPNVSYLFPREKRTTQDRNGTQRPSRRPTVTAYPDIPACWTTTTRPSTSPKATTPEGPSHSTCGRTVPFRKGK